MKTRAGRTDMARQGWVARVGPMSRAVLQVEKALSRIAQGEMVLRRRQLSKPFSEVS
jgi:hypothetical protein